MASKRDLYEILGVDKKASAKDIKSARDKLARKYHSDLQNPQADEEKMKEINGAYEVLGDRDKRQQYDSSMYSDDNFREAQEEAERREKARQEEERIRRQRPYGDGRAKEREEPARKEPEGTSYKKFFAVALVLGVLLLGIIVLAPGENNAPETTKSPPTLTPSPSPTPTLAPETLKSTPFPFPDPPTGQKTFTNSIGMEFVLIPAGEFDMGSPSNEKDRYSDEGPVHRVKISKAFYMGKYEVTQKQWRELMGDNPSDFKGDNLPVERVSWNDAQEFIKKLNEKEGTNKYRLPSEAEWEYAARAGTTTRYSFGDDESKLREYAGSLSGTHGVGRKKSNPWGLYDVHGNVWEWVQDIYHSSYIGAPTDGSAWEGDGSDRVLRGGGWDGYPDRCRSAYRNYGGSEFVARGYDNLGFRLLRASTPTPTLEATPIVPQTPGVTQTVSPTFVSTPAPDQKTYTNSIGMEFVQIPAGEFDMGSPSNEAGRYDDEGPVHHVKTSNTFYMGKYEVTQKQWREVMGTNPSYFEGDKLPVERVSWNGAQEFIKKLNEKEGMNKYRLPSEAEWEYAARAGTTTRYSFGDDESKLGDYAWYYSNSGNKSHEVGQKEPNPWGLYDMHGNVGEWVQDKWYGDYNGAPTDGSAWEESGSALVIRGGSWNNLAGYCRSAVRRGDLDSDYRFYDFGFRLVRDL